MGILIIYFYETKLFTLPVLNGVTLNLSPCAIYLDKILDQHSNCRENIEERNKNGFIALLFMQKRHMEELGRLDEKYTGCMIHWLYLF